MNGDGWFFAGVAVGLVIAWPRQGGFWRVNWMKREHSTWWIGFGSRGLPYGPLHVHAGQLVVGFPWFVKEWDG